MTGFNKKKAVGQVDMILVDGKELTRADIVELMKQKAGK